MAYQNVGGTPRFYIDTPSYLNSLGIEYGGSNALFQEGLDKDLFGLNPINQIFVHQNYSAWSLEISLPTGISNLFNSTKSYLGFLNHSIESDEIFQMDVSAQGTNLQNIINFQNIDNQNARPIDTGFSMYSFSVEDDTNEFLNIANIVYQNDNGSAAKPLNLGCLTFGSYYDMPVSPDLDLSMEIEFDGVKNVKTLTGATITQANYQGSPWWYDVDGNKVEPWSIGESTGLTKRQGRRIWNLKFSYMSDKDLFASNYGNSDYNNNIYNYDISDILLPTPTPNLIANGDFSDDDTGWSVGSGVSIGSNIATWDGTAYTDAKSRLRKDNALDAFIDSEGFFFTIKYKETAAASGNEGYIHSIQMGVKEFFIHQGEQQTAFSFGLGVVLGDGESRIVEKTFYAPAGIWYSSNNHFNLHGSYTSNKRFKGTVDDIEFRLYNAIDYNRFYYNIDNDDSFSAQVLNKVSHGEKFIFQPDNTSNNPSDFAICVLDGDSFSIRRSAFNVYNIEMKIREVW